MDSNQTFEKVVIYLEACAKDGTSIDYSNVSLLAGCPAALFQRIFIYITGVTVAEYVRRRRLSLSGKDVLSTRESIIDIAMKFGYESHASFTRAFKQHHGCSPTDIRRGKGKLNNYPCISFINQRIVGGRRIMAECVKIEYADLSERLIVGMERWTSFARAGKDCWERSFKEGVFDKLAKYEQYECKDMDDYIGLGHMSRFQGDEFNYIVGKFMEPGAPVSEGLSTCIVPAGRVAKIWIESETLDDIINCAYFLCEEAIKKTGYRIDHSNFFWCDIYTNVRYADPLNNGKKIILDYLLPVVKE